MKYLKSILPFSLLIGTLFLLTCTSPSINVRKIENFNTDWKFNPADVYDGSNPGLNDSGWRMLNLPHDWSIEGAFSKDHPATVGGGALPGGIGWYRKSFLIPGSDKNRKVFIEFDGIYKDSEVWINGRYLGKRPNGYISFSYELTEHLNFAKENVIAVKVDNSKQPNSRWYSGSGIYRNVRLLTIDPVYIDQWGTYITTPKVSKDSARVNIETQIINASPKDQKITITTKINDSSGKEICRQSDDIILGIDSTLIFAQKLTVINPLLWSVEKPNLYKAITILENDNKIFDNYETTFGIRSFKFSAQKGFLLNGEQVKIKGICNHHDLGCLGAAVNTRALERQLEILKNMGCNGIRTAHNPPAPELLDLCDRMGFIVMDEAYDVWAKKKTEYDYHLDFAEWHKKDLQDFILRDRNHPSVFMWSIGNEVIEQWDQSDSSGSVITRELADITRSLDTTRYITAACNGTDPNNPVIKSGALDIIGFNYNHEQYIEIPEIFPGKPFIGTETESSLATRGSYDMPSDSVRRWPPAWDKPLLDGNADHSCSAYDNCSAPWGSTHEETWDIVKKYDHISGMYTWTGFDYLGEPTPYTWPARSSYFGIIDLAGFPKDAYYLFKSEWTDEPVLHVFPHWNWSDGEKIDVWVYTNTDEVELFLNGQSQGTKSKTEDLYHLTWPLTFKAGEIKAIARMAGKDILSKTIKTASEPSKIELQADRQTIISDGVDLSFITVKILDENNTLVPRANNLINFNLSGPGEIAGVDNGHQTSHESFKANYRKAFNGLCLVVVKSGGESGEIILEATSENLESKKIVIKVE